ncbi:hypothetical protein DCCM_4065 [Desulfocucumis palustris]|uniref:Uncharacterized protein n=1 Tax=Desulfocucumis palustris TaxID=1898651 RepID=A0A2L2XFD5_9FIRM|nr:hypothetical protein [Desulfocucumis palustris]GBF34945.1 hypothetical protein DCCM_4065 [Desulfocucumis palustris]
MEEKSAWMIINDLSPVWDISEALIDWGLKLKYGVPGDIVLFPEFAGIVEINKSAGSLEELLSFPSSFYSWPDRAVFVNLNDYSRKKARGYNSPVHELGHACHHFLQENDIRLARQITRQYQCRKEKNRFLDSYSHTSEKEFFAQYFMHFHNTMLSMHPAVKTKWELKMFDPEFYDFIIRVKKDFNEKHSG